MKGMLKGTFSTNITREKAKDSGMAVVLILLLIAWFSKEDLYLKIATAALLMDMIFPMFYYPFAILWFGLSDILGAIVSRILLSAIYIIFVLPVAMVRRGMGKDPLLLKQFKKRRGSVLKEREKSFTATDLEKPF